VSAAAGVAGFLLSVALKATLILVLAAVAERLVLRRASAAARHLLWSFALAGVLLLPLLDSVLPAWRPLPDAVEAPALLRRSAPMPAPSAAATQRAIEPGTPSDVSIAAAPEAVPVTPVSRAEAPASIPWAALLLAGYAAGVLLLLGRVVAEHRVVRRLGCGATPVRDAGWGALLQSVAAHAGVRRPVALLRSDGPTMPLTWGVVRPAVLLPADADEWPEARRRAVLIHELAHVARHDCLTQTLAAIACALYWPHPGVWGAARRLRVERELACDDQALARGIVPCDYAGHLLELARRLRSPRALTAVAVSMASPSHLELRLLAAIDGARVRTAPGRRATLLGAAITALLLVPIAAIRATAEAAEAGGRPGATPGDGREAPASVRALAGTAATDGGVAAVPPAGGAGGPFEGEWTVRMAGPAEVGRAEGMVHVALRTPGLNTFYVPVGELQGLTAERITRGEEGLVHFRLRRDAGTFAFEGAFRGGRGSGRFGFTADPAFADALARRGMQRPTPEQQFSLGRHGATLAFLDELAAQGYAVPSTEAFDRAAMSSADLAYLREMARLGYRLGTLDALVDVSDEGVGPAYVGELAALGYRGLPAADLVRLRNEGIDAAFVRRANASAGRVLAVNELLSAKMDGGKDGAGSASDASEAVGAGSAAFEPAMAARSAAPADAPSQAKPLTGRWVLSGGAAAPRLELLWDDDTQWRRPIALAELSGMSAGDLGTSASRAVSFRMAQDAGSFEFEGAVHGGGGNGRFHFRPNHAFAGTLRSLGVAGVGGALSDHQLKNLAFGGIGADEVRGFLGLGYTRLTLTEVVDLAVRNVTPEYAQAMRSLGVRGAGTVDGVIELRFHGVTLAYVRELGTLGYHQLSVDQLSEMWRAGVTPAFIRGARQNGGRDLTPEALIELKEAERERSR